MAKANDPVAFTQAIKAAGYASDPDYVQKVINTPEFQHLQHFKPSPTPSPMPKPTLPPKQHTLSDQIISPLAN
jgi:flagellum-specific peptidoglycan hydrolase FlgJ